MKVTLRRTLLSTLVGAGAIFASGAASAAGMSPAALAEPCAGCHGTDGSSVGSAPTIANLTVDYFVLAMKDYASGTRPSTVMGRLAKGYTEGEIKSMAEFFDKKPFVRYPQTSDAKLAEKGKALQAKYCQANCHEAEGRKSDGIGVLAGQRKGYLSYAIDDFLSGKRPAERRKKQFMDDMTKDAGPDAYAAVIQFYVSQK